MDDIVENDDFENKENISDFLSIRDDSVKLTSSEDINKESALKIMHIQHEMEILYMNQTYKLNKQLEDLKNQLVVVKLTHSHAEMIEKLAHDNNKCQNDVSSLKSEIVKLTKDISENFATISKRLEELERNKRR